MPQLVGPLSNVAITTASSGDNNVVAAVTGQKVYLYSAFLVAAATVTLTIKDTSTGITGAMTMIAGVPFFLPPRADGTPYHVTASGGALNFSLGGSVQLSGWIKVVQI